MDVARKRGTSAKEKKTRGLRTFRKGPRVSAPRASKKNESAALVNNEMENSLLSHGILSHRHAALAYRQDRRIAHAARPLSGHVRARAYARAFTHLRVYVKGI